MFTDRTISVMGRGLVSYNSPHAKAAALDNLLAGTVAWINRLITKNNPGARPGTVSLISLTYDENLGYSATYTGSIAGLQEYLTKLCSLHKKASADVGTLEPFYTIYGAAFLDYLPCFEIFDFCSIPGFTKESSDEERYNEMFPVDNVARIDTRDVEVIVDKIPHSAIMRRGTVFAKITVSTDMLKKLSKYRELDTDTFLNMDKMFGSPWEAFGLKVSVDLNRFTRHNYQINNRERTFMVGDFYTGTSFIKCFTGAPGDFSIGDIVLRRLNPSKNYIDRTVDNDNPDSSLPSGATLAIYPTLGKVGVTYSADNWALYEPRTVINYRYMDEPFLKGNKNVNDAFSVYLYIYNDSAEPYDDIVFTLDGPLEINISAGR